MTVAELRTLLAFYPDDVPVYVRTSPLAEYYCLPLDGMAIRDIVPEPEGGYDDDPYRDDDRPQAVPTLVLNDLWD